jgi:tRNA(Ile)-lysidine synthase
MELVQKFQTHWKEQFSKLSPETCRLLLAVSGGVDSVVLVDLVQKTGLDFEIAHMNFQLRREESERDEAFVRSLAAKYGKEALVKRVDTATYATTNKRSIQEAARELRYTWFRQLIGDWAPVPAGWIVTAHHADDNIETMLMHFFRGTGIQGLTGIQPLQEEQGLLRPLLPFRKQELLAYADENGLGFVEDSSNASDKYTRNFFRNSLLPQIKEVFPQVEENLLHNMERFTGVAALYNEAVAVQLSKLVETRNGEWHIPILKWKKSVPLQTISWELIKPYGFSAAQTNEVIKLLDAENGSYIASPTHRIIRNRNWMIISPNATTVARHILIEPSDKEIAFENGTLYLKQTGHQQPATGNPSSEAQVNLDELHFPLLLRKWKQGDYFYPLGMQKKKKISRFLIDQKLSKTDKEKLWVLESNRKIIWVVGHRIDDRFKLTENTKNVLLLSYLK